MSKSTGSSASLAVALLLAWPEVGWATACPRDAIGVPAGASIQEAVIRAGPGASLCIKAGLHRLQVVVPLAGQRFYGEPGTVLNGARVIASFEREGAFCYAAGLHPRVARVGQCSGGGKECLVSLSLFRDGQPMVRTAERDKLEPGEYVFDAPRGRIYLAEDPTGHLIEASTAVYAFRSLAPDVRITGLLIEKYDSPVQQGAIQGEEATGWTVEGSEIRLNAGGGVSVGTNGVIRANAIHHNGQLGATAGGHQIRIEDNTIFANNLRGFDPGWEAGGVKVTESANVVLRGNRVHHNQGPGLWCDIDCRNVLFEGNNVEHNAGAGIFYEISSDAVIRDNILRFNGLAEPHWFWGADIQVAAAQNVEVTGNTITVRPGGRSIMLIDQGRRSGAGTLYLTRHNRVHDNRITYSGPGSAGGVSDVAPDASNADIIATGANSFDRNTYIAPAGIAPGFIWGRNPGNLEGFRRDGQELTGNLVSGTVTSPSGQ